MRCDLHTHSVWSGAADLAFVGRFARDSYSDPLAIYATARRRGMDLVTLTDHDTIDGNIRIAHLPGVFTSEEVTCALPSRSVVHLGVLDITESDHFGIASRRDDGESLFAFLAERQIPVVLNHMFSPMTGPRSMGDYEYSLAHTQLVESRNGSMPGPVNAEAARVARRRGMPAIGGSDAHTIATVARAYTEIPVARTREEYLAALRNGTTIPKGRSGSYTQLAGDIARVTIGAYREIITTAIGGEGALGRLFVGLVVAPLTTLIPLVALVARARAVIAAHRDGRCFETWPFDGRYETRGAPMVRRTIEEAAR